MGFTAPTSGTAAPGSRALRDQIRATVTLPHYFGSAFDRRQVHRYLPVPVSRADLDRALDRLIADAVLTQDGGCVHAQGLREPPARRRAVSRDLFGRHRRHLRWLSSLPGVRYMGLTGANAFESCRPQDDLDLFVVTSRGRLWLTFVAMIVFSRLVGRRDLFCINYLVDEDHLRIAPEDYYTAVQLMSMVPLIDRGVGARLMAANAWVLDHLPNCGAALESDGFYALEALRPVGSDQHARPSRPVRLANRFLYAAYARRLRRKYPNAFGKGIVVAEGLAKLHRIDYGDLYQRITAGELPPDGRSSSSDAPRGPN